MHDLRKSAKNRVKRDKNLLQIYIKHYYKSINQGFEPKLYKVLIIIMKIYSADNNEVIE